MTGIEGNPERPAWRGKRTFALHGNSESRPEKLTSTATRCAVANKKIEEIFAVTVRPISAPYKGNWSSPTPIATGPIDRIISSALIIIIEMTKRSMRNFFPGSR